MVNPDYRLRMKDLPASERPYERLESDGAQSLSNAELFAIILKTGTRGETSLAVAQRLLARDYTGEGLGFLYDMSLEQLKDIPGIGRVKAIQLKAVMELSKRVASTSGKTSRAEIKCPDDICHLLMEDMRHLKKEEFRAVLLNTKNRVLRSMAVSVGSLNASIVHPREVFSEAVKTGCAGIIFAHNHPSGDPEPSTEDIGTTRRLVNAGDILGIKVLDHVIIGDGRFVSLKERGLM